MKLQFYNVTTLQLNSGDTEKVLGMILVCVKMTMSLRLGDLHHHVHKNKHLVTVGEKIVVMTKNNFWLSFGRGNTHQSYVLKSVFCLFLSIHPSGQSLCRHFITWLPVLRQSKLLQSLDRFVTSVWTYVVMLHLLKQLFLSFFLKGQSLYR